MEACGKHGKSYLDSIVAIYCVPEIQNLISNPDVKN